MTKIDKNLIDKYFKSKKAFEEIQTELFPRIFDICKVCTRISFNDRIQFIDINDDEDVFMLDEPEVCVHVENWDCGPDTYYFPKRYLDMTIEEIKADVKARKEAERKERAQETLEAERKLYQSLKRKFEKKIDSKNPDKGKK